MKRILILTLLVMAGCTFPRDPENSFEEAQKNGLKVGVVKRPPFVNISGENFSGSEIDLIREFAEKEHLQIEFKEGSETELLEELEKFHLQVVAGGFTKKTIWKKKAGLTAPYDSKHVLLIPKGENRLLERLEAYILPKKSEK